MSGPESSSTTEPAPGISWVSLPADIIELAALRGADVVKDCACGCGRSGFAVQAEAFKRDHSELVFEQRYRIVSGVDPIFKSCFRKARTLRGKAHAG